LAVSAIAVAASIVIAFILWPNSPAVVEQPVVAEVVEQPVQEVPKTSDYSESSEYSDYSDKSEPSEPVKPKRTYKACKAIEEPQLAQAEKMPEEAEVEMEQEYLPAETDPFLLAAVEAQDIRSRGEHLFHEVVQMINNR
jgi:cytoskeletal protein RodZ